MRSADGESRSEQRALSQRCYGWSIPEWNFCDTSDQSSSAMTPFSLKALFGRLAKFDHELCWWPPLEPLKARNELYRVNVVKSKIHLRIRSRILSRCATFCCVSFASFLIKKILDFSRFIPIRVFGSDQKWRIRRLKGWYWRTQLDPQPWCW